MYNKTKNIDELNWEMGLYGAVDIAKPEVKFEKAYYTLICNPEYNNNEVRLLLYLRLNDSVTNYGAFPSNKKISEETGMSIPTISKTLASLEKKNAILIIHRYYKESRKQIQNLVMFNVFDEHEGNFPDNEVWKIIKDRYKTKMVWVELKKEDGKTLYVPTPIEEHEIKPRHGRNGEINGYTIL